ncbi:hypothetical protein LTR86_005600 [Recurvomyces mirabilis]|nr:hypothetical protein LTR86_005600 [Recurvomyces mirabilis]
MDYSALLKPVAEVLLRSQSSSPLYDIAYRVLADSKNVLEESKEVLERFNPKASGGGITRALVFFEPNQYRDDVLQAMEHIESLKSTLTIMLQTQQVHNTLSIVYSEPKCTPKD